MKNYLCVVEEFSAGPTAESYRGAVHSFIKWTDSHDLALVEDDDDDRAFCSFVTKLFVAAGGPQDERDKVDVWISVKFDLLSSLDHVTWAGAACCNECWAAREWKHNGDIHVRGGFVLIKNEKHACMFDLAIHHTGETWGGMLNVYLGATVRLNISKASDHCGMLAINTAAVPTPIAVVLVGGPRVCHRSDPLHFGWGMPRQRLRGLRLQGAVTRASWPQTRKQRSSAS